MGATLHTNHLLIGMGIGAAFPFDSIADIATIRVAAPWRSQEIAGSFFCYFERRPS